MPVLDFHQDTPESEVKTDPRLGRFIDFDAKSADFPIMAVLTAALPPRSYTWSCSQVLNQGTEGTCVGHGISHEILARPKVRPIDRTLALRIYDRATELDPWQGNEGNRQTGTSVLAGMKAATELGYYSEYRWAFSIEDLVMAIGYKGPAVLGIPWYNSMFSPNASGLITISGALAGGHCILAKAVKLYFRDKTSRLFSNVDMNRSLIRLHNSWGTVWGVSGDCYISLADLDRLLHEFGEACIPILRV